MWTGQQSPCATIAYAVNTIASAGSTVLVGPGTYTDAVTMQPGVDVIGQYGPAVTILDGGGVRGPLVAANGSSFSTPVLFAGVTVQHGYTAVTGGGIQIHNGAQMVISNTHIISNSAGINDGGISVRDGSSLQLVDCLVAENTQSGLWMSGGTAVVNHCIFRDNVGNSWGGGIGSEMGGALTVSDSSFMANSAPYGGGIMNSAAAFTLTNSIFISNTASSTGGGVHVRDGSNFTISGSTFSNNEANQGAGLLVASGSGGATSGSVSTNSFTANVASGLGGGIKLEDAATQVSIENNQLANNSADGGGGIHLTDSVATIQSNTLIGNTSSSNGGGIRILGSTGVTVTQNSLNQNEAANNGGAIATENVTNLLVAGNIVTNNVGGLDFAATSGVIENNLVANTDVALSTSAVKLRQNSTVTLRHNTLVGDGSGYGVNVTFGSTPVIANNIISDYAGGILGTGTVTPTLSHNLLWRIPALYDGVGAGSSDLVRDPDFVDVSTQDYHLGVCSFAVEAGDMAFGAVVDIDGETRPFSGFGSGTAITDIGADERLSVSIPPPWAGFTTTIAGLTVDFSNTTTNAAGYSWDFGDGTAVSTATSPRHTYTAPGTYLVTLTAVNANSCQDVVQVQVAVENYRVYLPLVVKP